MFTRKELLIAKAEYLLGRPITENEKKKLLKSIKYGTKKEISDFLKNKKNSFVTIEDIIKSKVLNNDVTKEELDAILKEIVIKSTSVESGLKIMKNAEKRNKKGLLQYIYNLYLRDSLSRSKIKKVGEGREAIIPYSPSLSPGHTDDQAWGYQSFYNPDQVQNPGKQNEYNRDGYLANEFVTRPSHNDKKEQVRKKRIKKYIKPLLKPLTDDDISSVGGKS